ncbi:MAG: hypothetical protein H7290_04160 [Flavobacterium sp.]|nr:hypothetical protein [Aeromicrobium sp.]
MKVHSFTAEILHQPQDIAGMTPCPNKHYIASHSLIVGCRGTTRIREHALKLGMTHLTETTSELVARAEADQMGYLDFVDPLLGEELGIDSRVTVTTRNPSKPNNSVVASLILVAPRCG